MTYDALSRRVLVAQMQMATQPTRAWQDEAAPRWWAIPTICAALYLAYRVIQ